MAQTTRNASFGLVLIIAVLPVASRAPLPIRASLPVARCLLPIVDASKRVDGGGPQAGGVDVVMWMW